MPTQELDWDKLRIFHAAAEAGSFTHAGELLNMSQSAVSRQVSALEKDLTVDLFHRHARGLALTEQGELLFRTAHEVFNKLKTTRTMLADSKAKPSGVLRVTSSVGLGSGWLTPRLGEFIDLYPDIKLEMILSDKQLDLSMREADIGFWTQEPIQNGLIRRPLFTVHLHAYASAGYLKQFGVPRDLEDLDNHRIMTFGGAPTATLRHINWLETAGRNDKQPRTPVLSINSIYGLKQAVRRGIGIAVLPDYLTSEETRIVKVLEGIHPPEFKTYFVYPEELRNSKRVNVFRDFMIAKAREWKF